PTLFRSRFVSALERAELVRRIGRYDHDLTGSSDDLVLADRKQCAPAPDDERLRVRMLVQPRTLTGSVGTFLNDRDSCGVRLPFEILRPLLAILPPVVAVDDVCAGRQGLHVAHSEPA